MSEPVPRRQFGVTVLEAMVTLAIAATMLTIGLPGLAEFAWDAKRDSQVMSVVATLNYGRSVAVKGNHPVTVCPSAGGAGCDGVTAWEQGWIVFADANGNGQVEPGEVVMQRQAGLPAGTTLHGTRRRVTFQGTGFSPGFNDTLKLCDHRGAPESRAVIVSNTGRVRVRSRGNVCP